MRIGILCESLPSWGGGFQQSVSMIESLTRPGALEHDVVVFTPHEATRERLLKHGIPAIRIGNGLSRALDLWSTTLVGNAVLRRMRRLGFPRVGRHLDAVLDDYGIDLAIFTAFGQMCARVGDHPIIVTIWDIDPREHPDLPEQFKNRSFERAERSLELTLTRSVAVIAISAYHAERLATLYHVEPQRIMVMPLVPSQGVRIYAAGQGTTSVAEVRRKYRLPDHYLFYPAYFSYHKNHLYILEALAELEQSRGLRLDAVFCGGSDPGDQEMVERQVAPLGLEGRVHFLGLVPDEDVPALYEGAEVMVMPGYYGPTNLPPLEAIALGCPVIYADNPGSRDELGEAALYCDLKNPSSLAGHLAALMENSDLKEKLRAEGFRLSKRIAEMDYAKAITPLLDDFEYLQRRWSWPANASGMSFRETQQSG